nr:hypothetical protein [Microctonus hyperodae filamentous virus]
MGNNNKFNILTINEGRRLLHQFPTDKELHLFNQLLERLDVFDNNPLNIYNTIPEAHAFFNLEKKSVEKLLLDSKYSVNLKHNNRLKQMKKKIIDREHKIKQVLMKKRKKYTILHRAIDLTSQLIGQNNDDDNVNEKKNQKMKNLSKT